MGIQIATCRNLEVAAKKFSGDDDEENNNDENKSCESV